MRVFLLLSLASTLFVSVSLENEVEETTLFDPACFDNITSKHSNVNVTQEKEIGCICGIFLTGQFTRRTMGQPKGNAALQYDYPQKLPCSPVGNKMCMNKCLDMIAKQLSNSAALVCGSIERDCYKEKAYLFFKNCKKDWINTNLSAGREFCCKDNLPYKCPVRR